MAPDHMRNSDNTDDFDATETVENSEPMEPMEPIVVYASTSHILYDCEEKMKNNDEAGFLESIGDIDVRNIDNPAETLFECAIRLGKVNFVRLLIEMGCSANEEGCCDTTPLGVALRYKKNCDDLQIIELLVDSGADVNETMHDYTMCPISFLNFAIKHEDEELANYLISKGAMQ